MHTFSIAGKTISIFPSIAPGAPIFYLNTYAGEGQQVLDAARGSRLPAIHPGCYQRLELEP